MWPESVARWSTAPGDPGPVWSPFIPCAMVGSHLFSGSLQNRISNFGFPGMGGAQRAGAITEGNRGYCGSKAPPVNHLEELHGLWGRMAPPKPTLLIVSWERELGPHGGTWEGLVICRARGLTSSGDREVPLPFDGPPPTPASSHGPLCWFPSSFPSWPLSSAGAFPMLGTVLAQWRKEVPISPEVQCRREETSNALGSWP